MKKIVCELCEGTEFIKENGVFICQGCGTKYSAEEARNMMREVAGDIPAPSTVPAANMPVNDPNQAQLDNILLLASTAYEAQNYAESENYCNKAIEIDATNYKAWNLKGKAVGWASKIDDLRIEEAAHSFCKAIDFAPDEEKENLKNEAVEELKKLGLALISLRKQRFSGSPDSEELNGFTSDKKTILDALLVLLSHGNAVDLPKGYLEDVATMMNEAGVAALDMAKTAWNGLEHPSQNDLSTYLDWNGNICEVFREAIDTSDDDDEEDIARYQNLIIALNDPIGKFSQTQEWNDWYEMYVWVDEYSLSDDAVKDRKREIGECQTKIKELRKKVAEIKEERFNAYWAAHADEKAALLAEKEQLTAKINDINSDIAKIDKEINDTKEKMQVEVPSQSEYSKLWTKVLELKDQRKSLGMFKLKEKGQIDNEITSLNERMESLTKKIEDEQKEQDAKIDKKLEPQNNRKNELNSEIDKINKRILSIKEQLSTVPEE